MLGPTEATLLETIVERAFQAATLMGSSDKVQTYLTGLIKNRRTLEQINDDMGAYVEECRTQADEELRKRGA